MWNDIGNISIVLIRKKIGKEEVTLYCNHIESKRHVSSFSSSYVLICIKCKKLLELVMFGNKGMLLAENEIKSSYIKAPEHTVLEEISLI